MKIPAAKLLNGKVFNRINLAMVREKISGFKVLIHDPL